VNPLHTDVTTNVVNFRRLLKDDGRGEPLDEVVCVDQDCEGLTVHIGFVSIFSSIILLSSY